jgi:hypothetical protein
VPKRKSRAIRLASLRARLGGWVANGFGCVFRLKEWRTCPVGLRPRRRSRLLGVRTDSYLRPPTTALHSSVGFDVSADGQGFLVPIVTSPERSEVVVIKIGKPP